MTDLEGYEVDRIVRLLIQGACPITCPGGKFLIYRYGIMGVWPAWYLANALKHRRFCAPAPRALSFSSLRRAP